MTRDEPRERTYALSGICSWCCGDLTQVGGDNVCHYCHSRVPLEAGSAPSIPPRAMEKMDLSAEPMNMQLESPRGARV